MSRGRTRLRLGATGIGMGMGIWTGIGIGGVSVLIIDRASGRPAKGFSLLFPRAEAGM